MYDDVPQDQYNQECIVPMLDLNGLKVMSPLGRGAKGVVFLVKEDVFGELWALKVILRDLVEKKNKDVSDGSEYKRICFERQVLSQFKHPLLPRLRGVLATDKIVAYAIDFCPGRDLNQLRKQQSEKMFSIEMIRFYAAELVLALEHLHSLGIAYRDLKPENILIQENGHIMLVDFDLSAKLNPKSPQTSPISNSNNPKPHSSHKKRFSPFHSCCNSGVLPDDSSERDLSTLPLESDTTEKSNSFVGTEEYVSPEIIQGNGHDFAVDWWSLGVVLYEMLYGVTPFKGENRKDTFFKILTKSPDLVGEASPLRDLIGKLLMKDPKKRIRVEEIKRHEFFRGTNWDLIPQMARPPYIPPASHEFGEKEAMEGIMKIDVESFVQRIFGGDEVEKQEKVTNQEDENTENKVWVKGLDNYPQGTDDFIVF